MKAATQFWRPNATEHSLMVVCKASFELRAGRASMSAEQYNIHHAEQYWNESTSLFAPGDLVPFKQGVDVVLVGEACASKPTRSIITRLAIGTINKSIEVFADRYFQQSESLKYGDNFTKMPLQYERAGSGPHNSNPVGVRPDAPPDQYGRVYLPNLQPPGLNITTMSAPVPPVAYAPIAANWPVRHQILDAGALAWWQNKWNKHAAPANLPPHFFNCAPLDQRLDAFEGDERLVLENLHPEAPQLVCRLPGVRPRAFFEGRKAVRECTMQCDTVWIDTSQSICTLTWRGQLETEGPQETGRILLAMDSPKEKVSWAQIRELADAKQRPSQGAGAATTPPPSATAGGFPIHDEHTAAGPLAELDGSPLPFAESKQQARAAVAPRTGLKRRDHTANFSDARSSDQSPQWFNAPRESGTLRGEAYAAPPPPEPDASAASSKQGASQNNPLASTVISGTVSPWVSSEPPNDKIPPARAPAPTTTAPAPPVPTAAPLAAQAPMPGAPATAPPAAAVPLPAAISPAAAENPFGKLPDPLAEQHQSERTPEPSEATSAPTPAQAPLNEVVVQLLWLDLESMDAVRNQAPFKEFVAALRAAEGEPEPIDFDAEPPPEEPDEVRDRKDASAILTGGSITMSPALATAMRDAVDEQGSFTPPMVLMTGRLSLPFDEVEKLKATVAYVTPLMAGNEQLEKTVEGIDALLQTPLLESSGEIAENLTKQLQTAFNKDKRSGDPTYLDTQTERILLQQRRYQKRTVLGEDRIRALLTPAREKTPLPIYLPQELSTELPMFTAFNARLLAEVHMQQDQYEAHHFALKAVALGRIMRLT